MLAGGLDLPYPLLAAAGGQVARRYGVDHGVGVFVVDRYGALWARMLAPDVADLPAQAEILEWLEFIEMQCDE